MMMIGILQFKLYYKVLGLSESAYPDGYIKLIDDNQSTTSTQGNWSLEYRAISNLD